MATVPTIKTRLQIDGVEDVKAQLKSVGVVGEKAFQQIKTAGGAVADGGGKATAQLAALGAQSLHAEAATTKFREGLHLLHPLLRTAGVEFGGMRAFSMAASAGMGALGAVIGGAVVISLAKMADNAEVSRRHLTALFGDSKLGEKAFQGLQKTAQDTGSDVGKLTETYITFFDILKKQSSIRFQSPEGVSPFIPGVRGGDTEGTFVKSLTNILRVGSGNDAEAQATMEQLKKAMAGGKLTAEGFGALPIGAQRQISRFVGQQGPEQFESGLKQSGGMNILQFVQAVVRAGDAAEKAAKQIDPTFTDSLTRLWNDLNSKLSSSELGRDIQKELSRTAGSAKGALDDAASGYANIKNIVQGGKRVSVFDEAAEADKVKEPMAAPTLPGDMVTSSVIGNIAVAGMDVVKALESIAGQINNVKLPSNVTELPGLAGGGAVFGGGTSTSDSIPAWLSHGEYVVRASAVRNVGVGVMDAINSGRIRFASGGQAKGSGIVGEWDRLSDEDKRDAIKYFGSARAAKEHYGVPGTEARDQNEWELLSDKDKRDAIRYFGSQRAAKEHYGVYESGSYSLGGLIDGLKNMTHFNAGGFVGNMANSISSISAPRFADGGSVSGQGHHTVDLRTNHGTFSVMASGDVVRQLSQAAVDRRIRSGGVKPSHYRG